MTYSPEDAPRWDLSCFFPAPDSPEYEAAAEDYRRRIAAIETLSDKYNVRRRTNSDVDADFLSAFHELLDAWNRCNDASRLLGAYINCLVTTDATNNIAKARMAELAEQSVASDKLYTRFIAWVGGTDVESLIANSEAARSHQFLLRKMREQAQHQMSEPEEGLAMELRTSGLTGWARLHGNLTALLEVNVDLPTGRTVMPMSAVRALANSADRAVRKAGYDAEIAAWAANAVPIAAAMNGIKGYQRSVRSRRGYADDVEPTLLQNNISRAALESMQTACAEAFPDFRRYMAAKAKALRQERLAWHDLAAPVGEDNRTYSWSEAEEFVLDNFARYTDRLADFARTAFEQRWIDVGSRVGKSAGAYCTTLTPGVSRIMMNFDGSFNGIGTLAHELGHGYHTLNLKDRPPLQRGTPSTLAETASIFCETIVFDAASAQAAPDQRLALLEIVLERNLQVVVDIHSRFLLEQSVFDARAKRDLTVPELNDRMIEAQRATYGTALESYHPYCWAVKGHYYGPTFYNYPYTFGLLFGLGLYSRFLDDPEAFKSQYDDLLSSTGMDDAVTLCRRFGFDIEKPGFWRSSLDTIRTQIDAYEQATG